MRRLTVPSILLMAVVIMPAAADDQRTQAPKPEANLIQTIELLTAEAFAGRGSGSAEAAAVADSLAVWLQAVGLTPAFDGGWQQTFALQGTGWHGEDLSGKQSRNVAGLLPGRGALTDRYVVVGAHYDHLGRVAANVGDVGPPARGAYYPGANDNASGVAILRELARRLASDDGSDTSAVDRRSVLFIAFGAEEVGLQGSAFLVANPPVALERIDAMINLDSVGRMRDRKLYVGGVGTADPFTALVAAANEDGLDLVLSQGGWSGSDHMVFNTRQVPVLFIFSGAYPEYNRPEDDWPSIVPGELVAVWEFTLRLTHSLRSNPGVFTWREVAPRNLRPTSDAEANKDTWFGSLPDFAEDVAGYAIAGVFDGSPAARAGLQKGDVLIDLGGREVIDLATFTTALRSHDPGDLVEATVLRDGRTLHFTLELGSRSQRK